MIPDSIQCWSDFDHVAVEVNGEAEYLTPEQAEGLAERLTALAGETVSAPAP